MKKTDDKNSFWKWRNSRVAMTFASFSLANDFRTKLTTDRISFVGWAETGMDDVSSPDSTKSIIHCEIGCQASHWMNLCMCVNSSNETRNQKTIHSLKHIRLKFNWICELCCCLQLGRRWNTKTIESHSRTANEEANPGLSSSHHVGKQLRLVRSSHRAIGKGKSIFCIEKVYPMRMEWIPWQAN